MRAYVSKYVSGEKRVILDVFFNRFNLSAFRPNRCLGRSASSHVPRRTSARKTNVAHRTSSLRYVSRTSAHAPSENCTRRDCTRLQCKFVFPETIVIIQDVSYHCWGHRYGGLFNVSRGSSPCWKNLDARQPIFLLLKISFHSKYKYKRKAKVYRGRP